MPYPQAHEQYKYGQFRMSQTLQLKSVRYNLKADMIVFQIVFLGLHVAGTSD